VCTDMVTTIISVSVFITPVCMYRHFGHLAILSLFSIATIVAVLGLVFIAGPIKHSVDHSSSNYKLFDLNGLLTSVGSIVFSMECCSANFQAFISTERKSRNMPTWRVVTGTAVFVGAIMCASMGLVGYLSFGDDTEGEILDNFAQHGYDVFKLMVVIHLILYIPVNFVIMRYSIVKVFFQQRSEQLPMVTHSVITLGLLAGTVAIVVLLLGLGLESGAAFSLLLNITGGIGGEHSRDWFSLLCGAVLTCHFFHLPFPHIIRLSGDVDHPRRHLPQGDAHGFRPLQARLGAAFLRHRCHGRRHHRHHPLVRVMLNSIATGMPLSCCVDTR